MTDADVQQVVDDALGIWRWKGDAQERQLFVGGMIAVLGDQDVIDWADALKWLMAERAQSLPTPAQFLGAFRGARGRRLAGASPSSQHPDDETPEERLTAIYDRPCTRCAELPVYLDRESRIIVCMKCDSVRVVGRTEADKPRVILTDAEYSALCSEYGQDNYTPTIYAAEWVRRGNIDEPHRTVYNSVIRQFGPAILEREEPIVGGDIAAVAGGDVTGGIIGALAKSMSMSAAIKGVSDPGPRKKSTIDSGSDAYWEPKPKKDS